MINSDEIFVEFCKSEDHFADMFTKPLPKELFEIHRKNIGVCEL